MEQDDLPTQVAATTGTERALLHVPFTNDVEQDPAGVPKLANVTPVNTPPIQVRLSTEFSGTKPQEPLATSVVQYVDARPIGVSMEAEAVVKLTRLVDGG